MKVIAIIDADFETSPLGLRSRLMQPLRGVPVIRRTLSRVVCARRLASVHLVVPGPQAPVARDATSGLNVQVETHDAGPLPWQRYVASSRKWSLDSWRGGLVGTAVFDECLNPWVVQALAQREGADAVAVLPGSAALIDTGLLDAMIAHYEKVHEEMRLTFAPSPPGLTACIYSTALLLDLAKAGQFVGRVMAYRPTDPQRDMSVQPCFYPVENVIAHAAGRCLADTAAGCETISRILHDCGEAVDALGASRWLAEHKLDVADLPEEVEVELTTEDPLAGTTLRPRGSAVPQRGPMQQSTFERLVRDLARRDDARLVLGGFGDPLAHPDWPSLLRCAREAGVFALAIRTPAVHLTAGAVDDIAQAGVDVVNVLLDAHTPQTYVALHGADHFEQVISNIEALMQASRRPEHGGLPLVVCEMIKTRQTMPEMEAFYDHWLNKGCTPVIAGPSHYAGGRPDLSVMDMSPPTRSPCPRLFHRCMVLADGTVTLCDQDFGGAHVAGHLDRDSLSDAWKGAMLRENRTAHLSGSWDSLPLCSRCSEWHRP